MTMQKHVTIVAILRIVYSSLFLLAAFILFFLMAGVGVLSGEGEALVILGAIGTGLAAFFIILSLPGLIGGIGLLSFRPWARIVVLVLGFLDLVNVPIGTALGIYTIWVLFNNETEKLFNPPTVPSPFAPPPPPPATPPTS
jgi:hypothetical protein